MIHHSNPKCDTCGYRHSDGHVAECLDCVLAATSEDISSLRGVLRRCADAMTELLDAKTPSSALWVELRLARDNARDEIQQ